MFENLKANWLPTLAGVGAAVFTLLKAQLEAGHIEWAAIIQAAFFALMGIVAKQFNVTGGSKLNGETSATPLAAQGMNATNKEEIQARGSLDSRFGKNFPNKPGGN